VRVFALGAPWELRALLWVLLVSLGCLFWVGVCFGCSLRALVSRRTFILYCVLHHFFK
jgi:hypothetical protein